MIVRPPEYDDEGCLEVESVNLKIVDFGIFGSISGIRMENIQAGSLKYMAPELFQGKTESSTQIDIWSIGLILHAMVMGFLPFSQQTKNELEKAICDEQLDYAFLRRIKTSSIKNDRRRETNCRLRMVSEDCIDLIMKMLEKDPSKRIEMIDVFDHPWVRR